MSTDYILPDSRRVGAFDAKTHFSQLINEVEKGASIEITRRGKIVACLISPDEMKSKSAYRALERAALRRKTISNRNQISLKEILEYRDKGRK